MPSPSSLRICICVCICICVIVFVYLHLQICACICTVICSCLGISVQTNIKALVRWIVFLTTWLCICHRLVDMYFSRTGSVFLSQILDISKWHKSGTGGPICVFKGAKSIRVKFPKPSAHRPFTEISCCSAGPHLMPRNGSWRAPKARFSKSSSQRGAPFGRLFSPRMLIFTTPTVIGHRPDLFTRTCSRVRASAKLTEGLWGQSTQKRLTPLDFQETIYPQATAQHSAVFQVRWFKSWT